MRIAIVKLSALGDIVHAMIVLQFIKKFNKEILIDWIVEESYKDLLEAHPDIDEIHVTNINKAKNKKSIYLLLRELHKIRKLKPYDLVIDMQGLIKSALISYLIRSKKTIGFDRKSSREPLSSIFYSHKFSINYKENIIIRNLNLIANSLNFNFRLQDLHDKESFLYTNNIYEFSMISNSLKNITIILGASNPSKCYSVEKFSNLAEQINANFIIIWGNKSEKVLADKFKKNSPKVNIAKRLSLDELCSLIKQSDLVIGGDTGPTHMAWALNVPSITLFGSTPGYRNSYETEINKILESDSIVNPLQIDKDDYSISNISVDEIIKISHLLLSNN